MTQTVEGSTEQSAYSVMASLTKGVHDFAETVADGFAVAVSPVAVRLSFESRLADRFPLEVTKAIKGKNPLSHSEKETIERVVHTDWLQEALVLDDPDDREFAAQATALGAVVCYGFGNFYAVAAHPCEESIKYVNRSKGRPETQVGSVTTTEGLVPDLFDWSRVPTEIGKERLLAFVNELYQKGPFGFRGPAMDGMHSLVVSTDEGVITTQIIAPGYKCLSNGLVQRILELTEQPYIFITSANLSHKATGSKEEPAHYKISGIQRDFGEKPGYIMVAHRDEEAAVAAYPGYSPTSTSIIAFHKKAEGQNGNTVLYLERHGSLHISSVAEIAEKYGFGLELGPKAQTRLPLRQY